MPRSQVDKLIRETRDIPTSMLEDLLGRYNLSKLRHRVHLVKGPARVLIPAVASRERIDLIVMGTVCRTGVPGFLIGNTAESVLQQVDCSVLAVKPEGFVTPVKL